MAYVIEKILFGKFYDVLDFAFTFWVRLTAEVKFKRPLSGIGSETGS